VFVIAHPCFRTAPWQWGLSYVNGIEVWCREWRQVPPLDLDALDGEYRRRKDGKLIYSISRAVSTTGFGGAGDGSEAEASAGFSANAQAALFWDFELVRGLKASPIGGSLSSSEDVALGRPVTYVFAREKSVRGILHGLRQGRTFVSSGLEGPLLRFTADVLRDGKTDVGMGGIVPVGLEVEFQVQVTNANGKKLQILHNGRPVLTRKVEHGRNKYFVVRHTQVPRSYSVYRVRVVEAASEPGFGALNVLALSSPIYAQDMIFIDPTRPLEEYQIKLWSENPSPAQVTGMIEDGGKTWVKTERKPTVPADGEWAGPPSGERVRTIVPEHRF
jgi:hypothetical protein